MKRFYATVAFLCLSLSIYADPTKEFWSLVPELTGKMLHCDVAITANEENPDFRQIVRDVLKTKQVKVNLACYYFSDGFVLKTITDTGEVVLDVGSEKYDVTYYRLGKPNNLELAIDGGLDTLICSQIPLYYWSVLRRYYHPPSAITDTDSWREVRFWIDDVDDKTKKQVALIRFTNSEVGLTSASLRQTWSFPATEADVNNPYFSNSELAETPEHRHNTYADYRNGIPFIQSAKSRSSIFGHINTSWVYEVMTKVQSVQVIPPTLTRTDVVKQLVGQHKKLRGLDDGLAIGRRPVPQKTPWLKWIAWALAIAGAIGGSYVFLRKTS